MAKIARWFLDITLDSETLRWWSGTGDVTFGGQTYTGLGTRFITPESLKRKASLKSEKVELEFDSSRQSDNSDSVGYLLDQNWRNRAIRLRRVAWDAGDGPDDGEVLADERGRIRNLADGIQRGRPTIITMELESGALAYLERRMETRSPASQQAVFAGDKGFDLIAQLEGVTLPWRTKYKRAGTVRFELDEEYTPYPREMQIGRFVTPGSFIYADTNQQQRKSLCQVFALADHRIKSLDRIWINGKLERSTALTHGVRTLQRVENDKGEDRCWVTFYDGRPDQVADPFLVSVASTWTSAHRLRGVACIIVEHRWDSDMANAYDYRFGGEGGYFYDRRQDSTAGGSGSQRWDLPLTWGYTTNAAVVADHYRSGIRVVAGSDALWFGVGEALDAVPYAEFAALANLCDENVTLKAGGTQKRYEVNGTLSAKNSHDKNLQKLADQMAARAIDQGGRISFRPPVIRTPVVTLTDADLIRDSESQLDTGANIDDMVNTIEGRFVNPANDYKNDDYPKVQIADYVDKDNGEISDTLNFDLEISAERAQRIAKLKIEDSRRILQITETYGTKAKAIEPGEWFVRQSTLRGFPSGKTFVADEVTRFIDGSMEVVASEVDPDQLVWDEETAVDLSEPPAFPQLTLPAITVPDIAVSAVELGSGSTLTPGIQLDVTLPADLNEVIADQTQMEYGPSDGSGGISGESQFLTFDPLRATLLYSGFLPSTAYAFRFRGIEFRGDGGRRYGDWSSFQTVTTTANATASSSGTASAVPWSGVTGTGKPDDNADVTGDNTAAAIEGQDWGATASEDAASNDRITVGGVNLVAESEFSSFSGGASKLTELSSTSGWGFTLNRTGSDPSVAETGVRSWPKGTDITISFRAYVASGDVPATLFVDLFPDNLPQASVQVTDTEQAFSVRFNSSDPDMDAATLRFFQVPSTNGDIRVTDIKVEVGNKATAWTPALFSREVIDLAGGGALAFLSSLANGGPYLSGFGALSSLTQLALGTPYLKAEDGSTTLTNNLLITSLGTAAAITGQTAWATFSASTNRLQYISDAGELDSLSRILSRPLSALTGRTADQLSYTAGGTVDSLKPAEAGADETAGKTAGAIDGQTEWATYGGSTNRLQYISDAGFLDSLSRVTSRPLSALTDRTADQVNYTGGSTVDSLKPQEAGANVTETRTASAISGQGWGATASEAAASNAVIKIGGVNLVAEADFQAGEGATKLTGMASGSGWGLALQPVSGAAVSYTSTRAWPQGADITISFLARVTNGSGPVQLEVDFFPDTLPQDSVQVTATLQSFVVTLNSSHPDMAAADLRFFHVTAGARVEITDIKVEAGNKATAWSPAPRSREVIDLAGGGALAFLSGLTNGGPYLSGFGALSSLAFVTLGSNVRQSDGSTVATDAALITSQGTAAAITGQTAWATFAASTNRLQYISDGGLLDNLTRITSRPLSALTDRTADQLSYTAGGTVDSLKPAETGANVTETRTAAAFDGQGSLAVKDAVDLASSEVLNKSLANLDGTANTKLSGIESGATVGAAWGSNLTGRPAELIDGRVSAGLTSEGDVNRALPLSISNASNLLRYSLGGVYTGELDADKTSGKTAAAITGQGWGATASEAQASNDRIKIGGVNLVAEADFTGFFDGGSKLTGLSSAAGWGVRLNRLGGTGVAAATTSSLVLPQGEDVTISGMARVLSGADPTTVIVDLFPDTLPDTTIEITVTQQPFAVTFNSSHPDMAAASLRFLSAFQASDVEITDIKVEVGNKPTAWSPAPRSPEVISLSGGGELAFLDGLAYGDAELTGFAYLATQDFVAFDSTRIRLADGTTAATESLVVTSQGTAAAITGQGALALRNGLDYSDPELTGFGVLSTFSYLSLDTTYLRLADGSTLITESLVVTSAGTAAAITGQGTQATSNMTYGAEPGSPGNGDFWADTANGALKFRNAGAWETIADITPSSGGGSGPSFTAAISGVTTGDASPGNTASVSLSADISDGNTGKDFYWTATHLTGPGGALSLNNDSRQSSIQFSKTVSSSEVSTYRVEMRVIKEATGETLTAIKTITLKDINV